MRTEIVIDFRLGITEQRTILRQHRNVDDIIESRKDTRAAEFHDAGHEEEAKPRFKLFDRRVKDAELFSHEVEKLGLVHQLCKRRIVLVNKKNNAARFQFFEPGFELIPKQNRTLSINRKTQRCKARLNIAVQRCTKFLWSVELFEA